jgi:hypothetical protein
VEDGKKRREQMEKREISTRNLRLWPGLLEEVDVRLPNFRVQHAAAVIHELNGRALS